jgi:hypothetical protein
MTLIIAFNSLKKRARNLDPAAADEIANTDVRKVDVLVDRYPSIVPPKYQTCHVEAFVDGVGAWVCEFDVSRSRRASAVEPAGATA